MKENNLFFRNMLRAVVLLLIQVLVLNNLYLGGFVCPVLYVLFVLMMPTDTNRLVMLLCAFASGLLVDISTNLIGIHAFCATLIAFCRITFADRMLSEGEKKEIATPCIHTVTPQVYLRQLFFVLGIYNLIYFVITIFDWRQTGRILLSALLSTVATWLLALLYLALFLRKKEM